MRRILTILSLIAGATAAIWWFNRPQPIVVSLVEVTAGAGQPVFNRTVTLRDAWQK